jgi:hypothetical protein
MRPSPLLTLLVVLAASTASAQEEGHASLEGVGRISVQAGWRLVSNSTFYDNYYSRPGNEALERTANARGGPLGAATFAYGITELVEIGIDLFGYLQRMQLTGQPRLTTAAYGALLGLRFRGWLDLGPEGTVPFMGILSGPVLASAIFDGGSARETFSQGTAVTVGATLRFTPTWGLSAEYRLVFARGGVGRPEEKLGSFNAGGSWFCLGVNYTFPKDPTPSRGPF